jgi:hypothetical protein
MKNYLTIAVLLLVPFGIILALIELAIYVGSFSGWVLISGLICLVALATGEIYERSK